MAKCTTPEKPVTFEATIAAPIRIAGQGGGKLCLEVPDDNVDNLIGAHGLRGKPLAVSVVSAGRAVAFHAVITPKEKAIDFPIDGGGEITLEIPEEGIALYLPIVHFRGMVLTVTLTEETGNG